MDAEDWGKEDQFWMASMGLLKAEELPMYGVEGGPTQLQCRSLVPERIHIRFNSTNLILLKFTSALIQPILILLKFTSALTGLIQLLAIGDLIPDYTLSLMP